MTCVTAEGPSNTLLERIMQIRQEIDMINIHGSQHITNNGEVKRLDQSCTYCQVHIEKHPVVQAETRVKKNSSFNELERNVDITGKNAYVAVPRNWAGKRVKILLID
jgi:putative transposon-encoded protein